MAKAVLSSSCLLLLWCLLHFNWSSCRAETNFLAKEKQVLDSLLHHSRYDARVRPVGVNGTDRGSATNVSINVYISAITNIDDVKMKLTLQLLLRQYWADPRLTFDDYGGKLSYLSLTDKAKIWLPDIFFPSEIGGFLHSVLGPNTFIRIKNGQVYTSNRLSLTLACPMNLEWYPFDRQECDLQVESYGMTSKDLFLSWDETRPVGTGKLQFPRFSLEIMDTLTTVSKTKTGEYHGLKLLMYFRRHLTFSLVRAFIPSAMLVFVSWLSFWLDNQAVVARLLVGVGTLLAASAHSFAFNWSMPAVEYTTSMDVWFGICLTFIFGALLETVWANYEARTCAHKPAQTDAILEAGETGKKSAASKKRDDGSGEEARFSVLQNLKARMPQGPARLDFISRIIFPLVFGVFNIFYWAINLCHSV